MCSGVTHPRPLSRGEVWDAVFLLVIRNLGCWFSFLQRRVYRVLAFGGLLSGGGFGDWGEQEWGDGEQQEAGEYRVHSLCGLCEVVDIADKQGYYGSSGDGHNHQSRYFVGLPGFVLECQWEEYGEDVGTHESCDEYAGEYPGGVVGHEHHGEECECACDEDDLQ